MDSMNVCVVRYADGTERIKIGSFENGDEVDGGLVAQIIPLPLQEATGKAVGGTIYIGEAFEALMQFSAALGVEDSLHCFIESVSTAVWNAPRKRTAPYTSIPRT